MLSSQDVYWIKFSSCQVYNLCHFWCGSRRILYICNCEIWNTWLNLASIKANLHLLKLSWLLQFYPLSCSFYRRILFFHCSLNSHLIQVLQSASGMYRSLNSLAMQLTKKNGFLMTCSCSGAMTQSGMFLRVLQASSMSFIKLHACVPLCLHLDIFSHFLCTRLKT